MNPLFRLFFLCVLALGLGGCAAKKPPKPTPLVYADWRSETVSLQEQSERPYYVLDIHYPQFTSRPGTASTDRLNQLIRDYVKNSTQAFKDRAPQDPFAFSDYPPQLQVNRFRVTYTLTRLKPRGHTIESIRLETETRYAGESTNLHHFAVFNYDLTAGQLLTLDSLFRPNSPYLDALARYCQKHLRERLADGMMWMPWDPNGSLPLSQNFQIWNLNQRGVRITFQEYQVTPYSAQPQVITVPYSRLRPLLSPTSPVSAYAYL